jgi:hypothetical protein
MSTEFAEVFLAQRDSLSCMGGGEAGIVRNQPNS